MYSYRDIPMTLRECFQSGVLHQKLRSVRPNTRRNYEINLRHFDAFLGRPATVDDLTDTTVTDCMWWLFGDGNRAARTANKFRDCILATWRLLHRKGLVDRWPDVAPLVEPERAPVAWTRPQLARLWEACDKQQGMIHNVPSRLWWHALHAVLWDSGERIAAVVRLEWPEVDLESGYVRCRAENRKGGRADRVYRLHVDTVTALTAIQRDRNTRVFPWPWTYTYLWRRYGVLLSGAGLPSDRQHKFHCVRKSVASYFEAAGGNATELLGHSSRRVTRRYLDPTICRAPQATDLLFRPDKAG